MLASPNFGHFVLDGGGTLGLAGPGDSPAIEQVLRSYYAQRGIEVHDSRLDHASDHTPFATAGIPVGGLLSGSSALKTAMHAQLWAARRASRSTRATRRRVTR
jgi:aminopeptidase S